MYTQLRSLRDEIADAADAHVRQWFTDDASVAAPELCFGAANLACYLALRSHDVRGLQADLADLGLSSLGRCEPHVLPTLDAIIGVLESVLDVEPRPGQMTRRTISQAGAAARETLERNNAALFGVPGAGRGTRIMVTMPDQAADDPAYVRALVAEGMDCARINCGHDDPELWARTVRNVRAAAEATGRSCTVLMDLSGPRLRTGPIGPGPEVTRVHPKRDATGNVIVPGAVILDGHRAPGSLAVRSGEPGRVSVDAAWIERLEVGDSVEVIDLPGRRRTLRVVGAPEPLERHCESTAGCFLAPGLELHHRPAGGGSSSTTVIGSVDAPPAEIRVGVGDTLVFTRDAAPGRPAVLVDGVVVEPACIPIGVPEAIDHLRPGERVFIDGGTIAAVVDRISERGAHLLIESARSGGARVKPEKGINFPDTDLALASLTPEDLQALDSVVELADAVGYSFVRCAADVEVLLEELDRRGGRNIAILAKIETADGVANLPEIIAAGASRHSFGVMIARGDLAVEIGYRELADVQEQILWICQAAHVPVVWATQVLDHLVHSGVPTRAEITDAAAAERAECVMLNKGPYLLDGVKVLHHVLGRMGPLRHKKTDLLPALDLTG